MYGRGGIVCRPFIRGYLVSTGSFLKKKEYNCDMILETEAGGVKHENKYKMPA